MDPVIYQKLTQLLVDDTFTSIEIIPISENQLSTWNVNNSHFPFLLVDDHLGIPRSTLHQAYIHAIKRLPSKAGRDYDSDSSRELVSSTAVILLANPIHNTALNRRKQLMMLQSSLLPPQHELNYMAALLGIKEASKSTILWHHRRWVLRRIYGRPGPLSTPRPDGDVLTNTSIPCQVLRTEFEVATRASESYPRNYCAWFHRYICVQRLISYVSEGIPEALANLQMELNSTWRWIEFHASDFTAMQYMNNLMSALRDANIDIPVPQASFPSFPHPRIMSTLRSDCTPTTLHALCLLAYYPVHESLWMYLRIAIATEEGRKMRGWIVDLCRSFGELSPKANEDAVSGFTEFAQMMLKNAREDEVFSVKNNAVRLLIWALVSSDGIRLDETLAQHFLVSFEPPGFEHLERMKPS